MSFNLSVVFPSFDSAGEVLSSIFIIILCVISFYFAFQVWRDSQKINKRIAHYSTKFSQFEGLSGLQFWQKRRELFNEAKNDKEYGKLWLEFDESLVSVGQSEEIRLYNVIDAAHFFNSYSLAEKLTENRLLAAIPGILTAVGVLGTFLGLTLGLGDFINLNDNSSADDIKSAVFSMIGGAGVAFKTSLYGVLFSLLFNYYEKQYERNIRQKISLLQSQIDFLFPRMVAEQTLSNIENHTENSRITLAGLSEKIGDRMQEVMSGVAQTISTEITQAIIPAINRLVENASNSSEKTLEHLISTFSEKIGSAGDEQRQALQQATAELARIPDMLKGMIEQTQTQLSSGISEQQSQDNKRQQQLMDSFNSFMGDLKAQFSNVATQNTESVEKMQGHLQALLEAQQYREQAAQTFMTEQFSQFQQNQNKTVTDIASSLENFMQQLTTTLQNLEKHSADTLAVLNERLTQQVEVANEQMKARETQANKANEQFVSQVQQHFAQINDQHKQSVEAMEAQLSKRIEEQNAQDKVRQTEFTDLFDKQRTSQSELVSTIHSLAENQKQAHAQLMTSLSNVIDGFKALTERHQQAVNTIGQTSQNMQQSASQLGVLSDNLKTAINDFGTKLNSAMLAAQATAVHQDQSIKLFDQVNQQFTNASQAVAQSADTLNQAVENAGKGANEIRQTFLTFNQDLDEHLNNLNKQIADLLSEYSQQVSNQTRDRLNEWNDQTAQYTSTMKDAISTLSSVVDEIETKLPLRS